MISCEFCEISKNTSSYRTPPVSGSENINKRILKGSTKGTRYKIVAAVGIIFNSFMSGVYYKVIKT